MPARTDVWSCCTAVGGVLRNRALFAGLLERAGVLREDAKFHEFQGLGAHRPRRCRALGIAERASLWRANMQSYPAWRAATRPRCSRHRANRTLLIAGKAISTASSPPWLGGPCWAACLGARG